jgi:parvulin-like peptidyl-prolyl isomerase
MLQAMRQHAKYFYVLFFIVILSFIFWGVGTVDNSGSNRIVAEVGKQKITEEEYYRTYNNTFRFYKDLYKENFDEEMQKQLNLKDSVLDMLIANQILLHAAAKNDVKVTDQELNEAIMNEPAFMNNGVFDNQIYQNTLRISRITPEAYESMKRQELTILKMTRLIEISAEQPSLDFEGISGDDQTLMTIREAIESESKNRAVKAYIEGYKKTIKVKENRELIS